MLLPESQFAGFTPPPKTIPDSIGHHKEWVEAIKGGMGAQAAWDKFGIL